MKMHSKSLRFIFVVFTALCVLFASCSGLDVNLGETSSEDGKIELRIAVDPNLRTAKPNTKPSDFDKFTLHIQSLSSDNMGSYTKSWQTNDATGVNAYDAMCRDTIVITTGYYAFTLVAVEKNGASYNGTVGTAFYDSNAVVPFTLTPFDFGNGTGNVSIKVNYSNSSDATNVEAKLYAIEDIENPVIDETKYVINSGKTINLSNGTFTYSHSNIQAGVYIAGFTFKDFSNRSLGFWTEIVQVTKDHTSSSTVAASLNKYFTITYSLNGGTLSPASQIYTPLEDTVLAVPEKANVTFAGWSTTSDGEPTLTGWSKMTRAGNITLYAKYRYTVSFEANGTEVAPAEGTTASVSALEGVALNLTENAFVRPGYSFTGWNTAADGSGTAYENGSEFTGTVNTTLYAQWGPHDPNKVVVNFRANGGTLVALQEIDMGETLTEPTTTRTHYNFMGWYTTSDFSGTAVDFATFKPEADTTLYAKWELEKLTVAFDSGEGGSSVASQSVTYGLAASEPAEPTKTGYTFSGWYLNNTAYNFNTAVTEAITLTARWTISRYSVMFNTNGGSSVSSQTVEHGSKATQPSSSPTRTGFNFGGWYKSDDGGTTLYSESYDFNSAVTGDMVLYAKWNIKQYTVTFNSKGGSEVGAQLVNHGSTATMPLEDPVKEGYDFAGWYKSSNNGNTLYSAAYNFNTTVTEDFTLYAKWTLKTYTVTFVTNGGTEVSPVSVKYGYTISTPSTTKDDYGLAVWYTDEDLTQRWNFSSAVTNDMTLYAKWLIGKKESITNAGDILFKDGSATAATSSLVLTDNQKTWARGVCADLGNDGNIIKKTILAVGQHWMENTPWCGDTGRDMYNNYIPEVAFRGADSEGNNEIRSLTNSAVRDYRNYPGSTYFTGMNYLQRLKAMCPSDANELSDFAFRTAWGKRYEYNVTWDVVVNGKTYTPWLPTLYEMSYISANKYAIKRACNALDWDHFTIAVGDDEDDVYYWTANTPLYPRSVENNKKAYKVSMCDSHGGTNYGIFWASFKDAWANCLYVYELDE